ncbi:hypothetical protein CROQUDRAFT_12882, partial [Cronartium quercuum f. sp. fusiforme G11]
QSDKKMDKLIHQTLVLSQICPENKICKATKDDKIYTLFSEPPHLAPDDTNEGIGYLMNLELDIVCGVDKIDDHLSTGPNGIELMLKWIGRVHAHPTWKGDTNSNGLLRLKLEKVCKKLE